MKIATVRDRRNHFSKKKDWLSDGEDVCIQKRGEPVALLTAMRQPRRSSGQTTDARLCGPSQVEWRCPAIA